MGDCKNSMFCYFGINLSKIVVKMSKRLSAVKKYTGHATKYNFFSHFKSVNPFSYKQLIS